MHFTELHFHLLPGVDDGPADMEEAVELARTAREEGTRTIVVTPHVRAEYVTDPAELPDRAGSLRRELAREDVGIEVHVAAELGHEMVAELSDEALDSVALGPTAARFLLMEAPFFGPADGFHAAAEELRSRGFGVLVAHPERSAGLVAGGLAGVLEELRRGSRLQVNAGSLLGAHGSEPAQAGRAIVGAGLAAAIASDAHGTHRPPLLTRGVEAAIGCGLPSGSAHRLASAGPAELLLRGVPEARLPAVSA
ncbi:MAG: hypothetical protein H0V29_11170 [Thermoleophilaceae bacterium]|nr:hypothetical protein [Thermoleophilaceae bacterium]